MSAVHPADENLSRYARIVDGVVEEVRDSAVSIDGWTPCPGSISVGYFQSGAYWISPKEWTRAQFKERLEAFAPGAWQAFIDLKDGGNPVAKAVYEEGWVPHTVIEQRNPKTLVMLSALQSIGVLTAEQIEGILGYAEAP